MATPQPGRSTLQNVASMASKGAPGTRGGTRAGLSPVTRALTNEATGTPAPGSSGWVYESSNYLFARWVGTLDTTGSGATMRTDTATPDTTDVSTSSLTIGAGSAGDINPTERGLFFVSWQITVEATSGPAPWGTFWWTPTTAPGGAHSDHGETNSGLNTMASAPLNVGSTIHCQVVNEGGVQMDYVLTVRVSPIIIS